VRCTNAPTSSNGSPSNAPGRTGIAVARPLDKRSGPGVITSQPAPDAQTPTTKSAPIVQAAGDIAAQIRRRRTAADRLPPLPCGHRDPVDCRNCRGGRR
jgi:hypothetical protein